MPAKRTKKPVRKVTVSKTSSRQKVLALIFILVMAVVGASMALFSSAATPNGKLVYSVQGDGVYTVNADGTNKAKLQNSSPIALNTPRHPNAQYVAYNQQRANDNWSVATDLDTMKSYSFFKRLDCSFSYHSLSLNDVTFRPKIDNNVPRLAYVLRDEDCGNERSHEDQLWAVTGENTDRTMLASSATLSIVDPVWSTDTNKIYYRLCERDGDASHCKLILRTGGSTPTGKPIGDRVTGYSVSGDGKKVVYQDNWQIVYIMNSDGTGKKQLLNTSNTGARVVINRNSLCQLGTKLLYSYASADSKNNALRTVSTDGKGSIKVLSDNTQSLPYTHWAWSPNCDMVAYEYGSFDGVKNLKVVNVDGSSRRQLAAHPAGLQTTLDW